MTTKRVAPATWSSSTVSIRPPLPSITHDLPIYFFGFWFFWGRGEGKWGVQIKTLKTNFTKLTCGYG